MLARLSSYTPTEVYVCLYRNKKAIQSFNQIFQCYWNFSIWGRISFGKKKDWQNCSLSFLAERDPWHPDQRNSSSSGSRRVGKKSVQTSECTRKKRKGTFRERNSHTAITPLTKAAFSFALTFSQDPNALRKSCFSLGLITQREWTGHFHFLGRSGMATVRRIVLNFWLPKVYLDFTYYGLWQSSNQAKLQNCMFSPTATAVNLNVLLYRRP